MTTNVFCQPSAGEHEAKLRHCLHCYDTRWGRVRRRNSDIIVAADVNGSDVDVNEFHDAFDDIPVAATSMPRTEADGSDAPHETGNS